MIRAWIVAMPLAFFALACASSPEPPPPPMPVVEAPKPPPPPPMREPAPTPVAQPVLPKTASPIPAIGLTGFGALLGAGVLRQVRRRILR